MAKSKASSKQSSLFGRRDTKRGGPKWSSSRPASSPKVKRPLVKVKAHTRKPPKR